MSMDYVAACDQDRRNPRRRSRRPKFDNLNHDNLIDVKTPIWPSRFTILRGAGCRRWKEPQTIAVNRTQNNNKISEPRRTLMSPKL